MKAKCTTVTTIETTKTFTLSGEIVRKIILEYPEIRRQIGSDPDAFAQVTFSSGDWKGDALELGRDVDVEVVTTQHDCETVVEPAE